MKQHQKIAQPTKLSAKENLIAEEFAFSPSPDEVARRAYFAYENQGSLPGHEVQHWLAAEADLITERELTRIHAFHQHSQKHQPTLNATV